MIGSVEGSVVSSAGGARAGSLDGVGLGLVVGGIDSRTARARAGGGIGFVGGIDSRAAPALAVGAIGLVVGGVDWCVGALVAAFDACAAGFAIGGFAAAGPCVVGERTTGAFVAPIGRSCGRFGCCGGAGDAGRAGGGGRFEPPPPCLVVIAA